MREDWKSGQRRNEALDISKEWVCCDLNGYWGCQIQRKRHSKK
jgi:hypothetical protein